jgi:hypothetical protein
MSTAATTPSTTQPANPAKGNQRGKTTLAAEIDRWQALVDNLVPQVDQMPGLKDQLAQFEAKLNEAKALRNRINTLLADTDSARTQRKQLLAEGGDLYSRLTLGLQSFHGPRSPRLREFGLKPRRFGNGRPRKATTATPTAGGTTATTPATAVPATPAAVASAEK